MPYDYLLNQAIYDDHDRSNPRDMLNVADRFAA